ncbi:response regulator [Limnofasciculus baicalensis]|uniref:Response regulator n=1 Tax=Limnofasciculus baicalensis BBK-W-15 TaxID=2699891 RepID=A0AAE3KNN1_9CYAN|nr:response regulator [Limnofasciculus baicalensis]MCP2730695.1 response regulator [Limnofasciculus baicalensis BBK-W-15]
MRILLVEDDEDLAEILKTILIDRYYLVDYAPDGETGWELADSLKYDLILLDVMLPKLDGITFCQRRRKIGDRTPILLLTAQDTTTSKIKGLDAGADDYVIKPFDVGELLARIRALLRRSSDSISPIIQWGELRLDPSSCEVSCQGKLLHLTAKEYGLLELFLRNSHRIFSQSALLNRLWDYEEAPSENAVRSHIKSLRKKLHHGGAEDLIETIYGLGYRLKDPESKVESIKKEPEIICPSVSESVTNNSGGKTIPVSPTFNRKSDVNTADLTRVLIVDDDPLMENLVSEGISLEIQVEVVCQPSKIRDALAKNRPDLVLLSLYWRGKNRKGFDLLRQLTMSEAPLPVIVLAERDNLADRVKVARLGGKGFLCKPISINMVKSAIEDIGQRSSLEISKLLIVDDDSRLLDLIDTLLQPWGFNLTLLDNPQRFWTVLEKFSPDLLILDIEMPGFSGLDLCAAVRNDPRWGDLPILFLSARTDAPSIHQVFVAGADDYVSKPIVVPELVARILNRLERTKMQRKLAQVSRNNSSVVSRGSLEQGAGERKQLSIL